jgi:hypothetical protein
VGDDLTFLKKRDDNVTRLRCFHRFLKVISKPPTDPDVIRQCEYDMMEFEELYKEKSIFTKE